MVLFFVICKVWLVVIKWGWFEGSWCGYSRDMLYVQVGVRVNRNMFTYKYV